MLLKELYRARCLMLAVLGLSVLQSELHAQRSYERDLIEDARKTGLRGVTYRGVLTDSISGNQAILRYTQEFRLLSGGEVVRTLISERDGRSDSLEERYDSRNQLLAMHHGNRELLRSESSRDTVFTYRLMPDGTWQLERRMEPMGPNLLVTDLRSDHRVSVLLDSNGKVLLRSNSSGLEVKTTPFDIQDSLRFVYDAERMRTSQAFYGEFVQPTPVERDAPTHMRNVAVRRPNGTVRLIPTSVIKGGIDGPRYYTTKDSLGQVTKRVFRQEPGDTRYETFTYDARGNVMRHSLYAGARLLLSEDWEYRY